MLVVGYEHEETIYFCRVVKYYEWTNYLFSFWYIALMRSSIVSHLVIGFSRKATMISLFMARLIIVCASSLVHISLPRSPFHIPALIASTASQWFVGLLNGDMARTHITATSRRVALSFSRSPFQSFRFFPSIRNCWLLVLGDEKMESIQAEYVGDFPFHKVSAGSVFLFGAISLCRIIRAFGILWVSESRSIRSLTLSRWESVNPPFTGPMISIPIENLLRSLNNFPVLSFHSDTPACHRIEVSFPIL